MSEFDTDRETSSPGRLLHLTAYGDTADEIELAALDQARTFFGPDRQLEVIHDYQVTGTWPEDKPEAAGKRFTAGIRVRTVEPS
jgi:hypothetical protein